MSPGVAACPPRVRFWDLAKRTQFQAGPFDLSPYHGPLARAGDVGISNARVCGAPAHPARSGPWYGGMLGAPECTMAHLGAPRRTMVWDLAKRSQFQSEGSGEPLSPFPKILKLRPGP